MKYELDLNQCSKSLRRAIALDDGTPEEIIWHILEYENDSELKKLVLTKPRSSEFLSHFADEKDCQVALEVVRKENAPLSVLESIFNNHINSYVLRSAIPEHNNVSIELLKKIATSRYEGGEFIQAMQPAILRLAKEGYLDELISEYFDINDFSDPRYDRVGGVSSKGLMMCLGQYYDSEKIAVFLIPEMLTKIFKNLKSTSIEERTLRQLEFELATDSRLPLDIVDYYLKYKDKQIRCATASAQYKRLSVEKVIELLENVQFYDAYNNHYSWRLLKDTRLEPDFLRNLYNKWNKRNLLTWCLYHGFIVNPNTPEDIREDAKMNARKIEFRQSLSSPYWHTTADETGFEY